MMATTDSVSEWLNATIVSDDRTARVLAYEAVVRVVVPVVFTVIAILGFVGNLSVIIVVVANLQMRSTTNTLIISLAVADLLFIVICVPFTAVSYAITVWPFGTAWCMVSFHYRPYFAFLYFSKILYNIIPKSPYNYIILHITNHQQGFSYFTFYLLQQSSNKLH